MVYNRDLTNITFKRRVCGFSFTAVFHATFASAPSNIPRPTESLLLHVHPLYELFFPGDEPLVLQIEDDTVTLEETAIIIPPFTNHMVKSTSHCYRFLVEPHYPAEAHAKEEEKPLSPSLVMCGLFDGEVKLLSYSPGTKEYLKHIAAAYQKTSPIREEEMGALVSLVFLSLYESNLADAVTARTMAIHDYSVVIDDLFTNHYAEDISLSTLAEKLCLSVRQTTRVMQRLYHTTFKQMLLEKRMQAAADLLKSTEMNIGDICTFLSIHSESYFFRLFRAKYGISPPAYRAKHKKHITSSP